MLPPADAIIHSAYQNNMLLGHFLQYIAQQNLAPANADTLVPGSVVAAVGNLQQLKDTGLPCFLRFGVLVNAQEVICQCCVTESDKVPEKPEFLIKRISLEEFEGEETELYALDTKDKYKPDRMLMAAQMREGICYYCLRSYPGDDFVAECLTGLSHEELVEQEPRTGQHWWTPLQMMLLQGLKWLGLGKYASLLPDSADIQVFNQTHHGIAIEGDQVIHFSTRRVPDESNRIKADSLKEFRSIGDNESSGSAVKYKVETPEQRLTSRNRAVWVFCHAESWGGYNLMDNNCEHFSRYCRAGKKESRQVIAAALEAMGALMESLPKRTPNRPLLIALALLMKNGARLLGRPEAAQEELPPTAESL